MIGLKMREKKIFIYLVITWFILLGVYIYLEKKGIKVFQTEQKVKMITIKEAQYKIDTLLSNSSIMENNQSLNRVVELLKRVDSNMFIRIASHTGLDGTSSANRILSQKQADTILERIKTKYPIDSIDAIGYGEEFPLSKKKSASINKRIEIILYSLPPKI